MKKIISILLVLVMALGVLALASCSKPEDDASQTTAATTEAEGGAEALKFGLGVYTSATATDATADKAGEGKATVTVAAVLLDKDGKIVKAAIDCADSAVNYTADGKASKPGEFKTKYEQGADYGMVAYGGAAKEWFEQADAFCSVLVGKTADDLAGLVAADYKGTEDVVNAGCTIYVSEFVKAVDAAIKAAKDSAATKDAALKLGISTSATPTDATAEKAGSSKVETTVYAAAVDADGKVIAATADCVEVEFTFDTAGKSTFDAKKVVLSKRQQGADYGMVAYAGSAKEWFEQADAFAAATVGKKASEFASLMGEDYKGNSDLQAAGCTIYVSGFVKAASKIG